MLAIQRVQATRPFSRRAARRPTTRGPRHGGGPDPRQADAHQEQAISEASSDFRPQPGSARGFRPEDEPEYGYPLDPPLEDVRIPVRAPHAAATGYSHFALMHRFPEAEVGADLHLLFSEGEKGRKGRKRKKGREGRDGKSVLAPDVLVALDVPRRSTRADYDADDLGPPDFVLEVLSRSTWRHDVGRKLDVYQKIGVRECLLFDVTGEDLAGLGLDLWGYALTPNHRRPLEERVLPNGERGVCSAALGLVAYVAAREPPAARNETWALTMRWHDPATGQDIPDYHEVREREAQALAGAERALVAGEERALTGEARALAGTERALAGAERALAVAQTERTRAEAAEARAEAAKARAEAAERTAQAARQRIAELEERLGLRAP